MGNIVKTTGMMIIFLLIILLFSSIYYYQNIYTQHNDFLVNSETVAVNSLSLGKNRLDNGVKLTTKNQLDLLKQVNSDLTSNLDKQITLSKYNDDYFITIDEENIKNTYQFSIS